MKSQFSPKVITCKLRKMLRLQWIRVCSSFTRERAYLTTRAFSHILEGWGWLNESGSVQRELFVPICKLVQLLHSDALPYSSLPIIYLSMANAKWNIVTDKDILEYRLQHCSIDHFHIHWTYQDLGYLKRFIHPLKWISKLFFPTSISFFVSY